MGTVPIRFVDDDAVMDIAESLSTLRVDGRHLWLGGDETVTIERLTLSPAGDAFAGHVSFAVGDFLPLPEPPDEHGVVPEIDIEGLDLAGGYLWFTGSHARTRKRVRSDHATETALARLARVSNNANRHLVGRIPILDTEDGPVLAATAPDPTSDSGASLTAAALGLSKPTRLTRALRDDPHLGPFLRIPSKDNGLDIEGLAVVGERIYLGLRGPVLRGWAVVLELRVAGSDGQDLVLAPLDGGSYRKHFLDLGGLGVRDMAAHGDDLLLLTGPTMDLDGPVRVYVWRGAAQAETSVVVHDKEIEKILDIPYGDGLDHAEGISLMPDPDGSGQDVLLVIHDSPAPARRRHRHEILADIVPLPPAGG
ncbi:hypothetical protein CC117_06250 [Parafrankia colletiae]|uniref:DUF3616 domain-containing protein n=2 Tax=Parafrankia colletiae TaxID=573497 RepID=A0A1S1QAP9_9ACTN|nr:DUF3616 domain-containing protein [Parafrankia colletiae]MCK9901057.1 DUF3616 domain-containing protein [Frankia sp. Cpl3]OHV30541.1 hypothetical protein CC117_06250 [Parafrankia colletiae]